MYPHLFSIGSVVIGSYACCLFLGFLLGTKALLLRNRQRKHPLNIDWRIAIWIFLGAMILARAYYILEYRHPMQLPQSILFWKRGHVFYGGLLGGLIAILAYGRLRSIRLIELIDILAPSLALGYAITRIGCFLNGCCFGSSTSVPWAVRYPRRFGGAYLVQLRSNQITAFETHSLPVHPTQLYAAFTMFITFIFLEWVYRRRSFDGQISLFFFLSYGLSRFLIEFWRADSPRYGALHLSMAQYLSFGLFGLSSLTLCYILRRKSL